MNPAGTASIGPAWLDLSQRYSLAAAEADTGLFTLGFPLIKPRESSITTSVCGLSFALPEIWVRFGLRLIVGAGPCGFGLRGFRGALRSGAGLPFVRRSGRRVGAHRELSRLSDRHGMAPMARAYNQAHKFGVETTIPSEVVGFDTPDANKPGRFVLRLASGDLVSARSIPSDVGGANAFHSPGATR